MNLNKLAGEVVAELARREEKLVLTESCTAGLVAATLGGVPGVSNHMCGSAVTYRADTKRRWLGIKKKTIKKHTTESHEVAREMAFGALATTPEAKWGVSVVGHLGPDAPEEKDGVIYICVVRRSKDGKIKVKDTAEEKLGKDDRLKRQALATEAVLVHLFRALTKKSRREEHGTKN